MKATKAVTSPRQSTTNNLLHYTESEQGLGDPRDRQEWEKEQKLSFIKQNSKWIIYSSTDFVLYQRRHQRRPLPWSAVASSLSWWQTLKSFSCCYCLMRSSWYPQAQLFISLPQNVQQKNAWYDTNFLHVGLQYTYCRSGLNLCQYTVRYGAPALILEAVGYAVPVVLVKLAVRCAAYAVDFMKMSKNTKLLRTRCVSQAQNAPKLAEGTYDAPPARLPSRPVSLKRAGTPGRRDDAGTPWPTTERWTRPRTPGQPPGDNGTVA